MYSDFLFFFKACQGNVQQNVPIAAGSQVAALVGGGVAAGSQVAPLVGGGVMGGGGGLMACGGPQG